ncbi:hypothetical protein [uncultured Sphingobium sp.]|uniref:hypothetical protein n=1 Tax=uncultured Sphingobium sp. TaxID=316087 RepID=UPI00259BE499|nr:hypothetical protein [uncultured Sphingobium sp.]
MSGFMRKAALVVGAVALVATTAGLAAPAVAATATTAATAGGVAGVSASTLAAIGTYGGLAAGVLSAVSAATAPGMSNQGSATSFQTNPQSGLPYAMGRTRMSGLRFFADTNTRPGYTKFNDLLWFGALLSIGGQIEQLERFTIDNEVVTFDGSGNAVGNYRDYQGQKLHMGGPQASALALTLGGGAAPGWTAQHRLSGITHAMWALRYNKEGEMYGAGAPEPAWIGKWVRVYDPRLDSTYPGGSGPCRALNEATYVWSQNPGLHALTWALGRWQNGKRTCGIGAPVPTIRIGDFVECANVCDANAWKVGGVEWTTDSKWDTLKRILQAGGARPTKTGAMIGCMVSTPRTAIATIESRHLLGSLSIAATKSRRDRFNSVIPRYVDEDSDWSVISGTAITVPEYVTADKGQRTKEIDYPLVQVFSGETAMQPGQLAAYDIVNSREAGPITFTTGPEWIGLKTGDVVLLNVPEEGLANQPILITRRAPDPATGKVSFSAQTETYSKHAYALGQSTTPPAPFSLTPPDLKPPAPITTSWAATGTTTGEGLPAIVVVGESDMPSADAVLIDYRKVGEGDWNRAAIVSANAPVQHVIAPLESETGYQVRIGYRVEQIDGDFIILSAVTGVGKLSGIEDGANVGGTIGVDIEIPEIPGIPAPPGLLRNDLLSLAADGVLQYQPYPDNADIKVALGQVAVPDVAGQLALQPDGTLQFETADGAVAVLGRIRLPDIGAASDASRRTLESAMDQISATVARVASEANRTRETFRDAGFYVDPASGEVRISAVDQTREQVSEAYIRLSAAESLISLSATRTYVNNAIASAVLDPSQVPIFEGLEVRITSAEVRLDGADAALALKAEAVEVSDLSARVTTAQESIDALAGQISLKVDSVDFNAVVARVASAEQVIEALGDTASITQALTAVRMLPDATADAQESALRAILAGDAARRYQVASLASARTELTAKINEDGSAQARARDELAVRVGAAEAYALQETQVRASETQALTIQVSQLSAQFNDSRATFTAQIATLASETEALAARSQALEAGVGENTAAIEEEQAARIAEDGTIRASATEAVTAARGLTGRVDTMLDLVIRELLQGDARSRQLSGALAAARQEITAKINGDVEAVVARVSLLLARMGAAEAAIVIEEIARATQYEAVARQITTLSATIDGANATFTQQIGALVTGALAATLRMDAMQSAIGNNAGAIENEASTRADADGRIEAAARQTVAAVRGVDGSAAAAAEQALRALLTGDAAKRDAKGAIAAARQEVTARVTADMEVMVQRVTVLLARLGLAEASIALEQFTTATALAAIAKQIETLSASIDGVRATVTAETLARADQDTALAQQITELSAQVTDELSDLTATITQAGQASVDRDNALAFTIEELRAEKNEGDAALVAQATTDRQARIDGDDVLASSIDTLRAEKDDDVAGVIAEVNTERQARIDGNLAIAASVEELRAKKDADDEAIKAQASLERQARIDGDMAIASSVDALRVEKNDDIGDVRAEVTEERQARIDKDAVVAASVESLRAEKNNDLGELSAELSDERQARIDEDGALAADVDTVRATVNGHTAEITEQRAVLVDLEGRTAISFKIAATDPDGTTYIEIERQSGTGQIVLGGNTKILGNIVTPGTITAREIEAAGVTKTVEATNPNAVALSPSTNDIVSLPVVMARPGTIIVMAAYQFVIASGGAWSAIISVGDTVLQSGSNDVDRYASFMRSYEAPAPGTYVVRAKAARTAGSVSINAGGCSLLVLRTYV